MSFSLGRKASQNGLTMIEMLLVMSVVILIIGVAVGMRASVGRNEAALRFVTEYQFLQTKMRAAFSPDGAMDSGGFELLTNALAIQRRLVPARWVQGTALQYEFGNLVLDGTNPWTQAGASAFRVRFSNMPIGLCLSVLPEIMAMDGVVAITSEGGAAYSPVNPLTLGRGQFAQLACVGTGIGIEST